MSSFPSNIIHLSHLIKQINFNILYIYIINDIYDNRVTVNLLTFRNKATVNLRGNQYTLDQKRIYL